MIEREGGLEYVCDVSFFLQWICYLGVSNKPMTSEYDKRIRQSSEWNKGIGQLNMTSEYDE